jgi:tetratricopeptide (TPR) repeat protein
VAEAVLLSLQAVRADDRAGASGAVMEVLSVLSAAGVRRDLLHAAGQAGVLARRRRIGLDAAAADEVLGRLAEGSLLVFTVDGHAVVAHRLVLRVVREQLAQEGRLAAVCRAAATVLETRAGVLAGSLDRAAVRDVAEQVAALQQVVAGLAGEAGGLEADMLVLRVWALHLLGGLGDSAGQAIAVGEPLVEDVERLLGPDHPDIPGLRNTLANAYLDAGRVAEAMLLHERTLADRERLLAPGHPSILAARGNLANAYRAAGQVAEAVVLYEQTLADMERVLGPDHPNTLASRGNLATAYEDAGRAAEAIPLHERTLADRERVLGPDHPDTLGSRGNLATAYQEAGRAAEAIPLHERTLADMERVLGPDHPYTLGSRGNLANAYREAGQVAGAIPLLERTLADMERVLGPDHPYTLAVRNSLAYAYQEVDRGE